jgi:hypothetical protein
LAGRVWTFGAPPGFTQGQGSPPKKAGFEVRYSESGRVFTGFAGLSYWAFVL